MSVGQFLQALKSKEARLARGVGKMRRWNPRGPAPHGRDEIVPCTALCCCFWGSSPPPERGQLT